MRFTHLGRDIRAVGGDRRASRMVGVEVDRVLIGVFIASAVCSALGGILLAYSFATALSNPGLYPLQFAVTAAILGGVSLVGGVGGVVGIAAGALTLSLLQELFSTARGADLSLEPHHRRIARAGHLRRRAGLGRAMEIVSVAAPARSRPCRPLE